MARARLTNSILSFVAAFSLSSQVFASPIIGNFQQDGSGGGTGGPLTLAVEFTTGALVQTFGSAVFYIRADTGTDVTASLRAVNAATPTAPGALLETLISPTVTTTLKNNTFTAAPFVLLANTSYWLQLDVTEGRFGFGTGSIPTGSGATYVRDYYSSPFFQASGVIFVFEADTVSAQAVPVTEPATVGLFVGAAMLGLVVRRRRK